MSQRFTTSLRDGPAPSYSTRNGWPHFGQVVASASPGCSWSPAEHTRRQVLIVSFRAPHCHSECSEESIPHCHSERSEESIPHCHSERSEESIPHRHSERSEESAVAVVCVTGER